MAKSSKDKKIISSVLNKVSQGKSYADVLKKLRKEVQNPDALRSRIVTARATQEGDVLILLDKESNKEEFTYFSTYLSPQCMTLKKFSAPQIV